jgi:Vanadium chloroperoxidase N-terminal domain/PAP2 superfamily
MRRSLRFLSFCIGLIVSSLASAQQPEGPAIGDPRGRDSILDWNAIALKAIADDFSNIYGVPDQKGPTHTSRALAIIHLAMFDAANMVTPKAMPYLPNHTPSKQKLVSLDAAVAQAAADTLSALYPKQAGVFSTNLQKYLIPLTNATARNNGIQIGHTVAHDLLQARSQDGSTVAGIYVPTGATGKHNVDPLNPGQGCLDPAWGNVIPFSPMHNFHYVPAIPPALGSQAYAAAFNDVKSLGGDGITTSTTRTQEQTEIGLFWAYDGSHGIGVPSRMYNQIARTIAIQEHNTEIENARLFGLVNAAVADAGIVSWGTKFEFDLWRPILGIRRASEDGNISTEADPNWSPLGSPASNSRGKNFTPNFPAYSSGHATSGAALFRTLQNYYGNDQITFTFVSDELNGITTDNSGHVRPLKPRTFHKFSDAAAENGRSRIYLGIHWQFDADEGMKSGTAIGDHVFNSILQPHCVMPATN